MNKGSVGVRFSITVPDDQICVPSLLDKAEKMWLGTKSWVRSKPCSECGSTRFIESESLERRLDRMAEEAKTEIADMADRALIKMDLYRFSRAASAETSRRIRMMSSPRWT